MTCVLHLPGNSSHELGYSYADIIASKGQFEYSVWCPYVFVNVCVWEMEGGGGSRKPK